MVRIARYNCHALLQTYSVKFVLEVLGAAGAIWGASEAIGLRNDENRWFFHWLACVVGFTFLMRWVVQLHRACRLISRGERRDMLSQMADGVDGDDDLALYQERDEEAGSDEILTRSGKKKRRGLDTAIAVATEMDPSYGTSAKNDSTGSR